MRLTNAGLMVAALSLAACADMRDRFGGQQEPAATATAPEAGTAATPDTRFPSPTARTVEDFDVTTAEERQEAAAAPAPGGERNLGSTVASLGDPAQGGFWLETPLVTTATQGRVVYPATGKSAQVELRPIEGAATAGSRISLAAMRLIEAPLTDLPTVEVYAGG
ncbi:hypothetical protein [Roseivivax isoporae]|uniref:D-galactarate dehydratase n=1 Tax=Roseivivax isoporae LMG 25204 TaxID=1449351 RepID=X7F9R5_9RHOB|nr:hypothetical protein [Roseivivax isoporae]ETX29453.1 hypothetical protein RISW2_23240 [Roseivivax isoporae LMG 25204]